MFRYKLSTEDSTRVGNIDSDGWPSVFKDMLFTEDSTHVTLMLTGVHLCLMYATS